MAGIDSYTKLMLHGNGDDGSQTIVDSEFTPKTVTAGGNAQLDTAQKEFGTASILLDGTGDYLTIAASADFNFPSDFTVDFWAYGNAWSGDAMFAIANTVLKLYIEDSTHVYIYSSSDSNVFTISELSTGAWHHFAVVRSGSTITVYIDGVSIGTRTDGGDINAAGVGMSISSYDMDGSGQFFNGWIDEFRVSKGIARWTSNFTPPAAEYTVVYTLDLTETCTMTDAKPLNSTIKTFSDGVTLTDIKPLKAITKFAFSDTVTLTDALTRVLSAFRTFSEAVTLTEAKVIKSISISKIESVSMTEVVFKTVSKTFTESVELLDVISKFITLHPFTETCTLTDSNNKTIIKLAFVDSMSITERYIWWAKASEKSTVWSVTTAGTTVWVAVSTATSPWTLAN